MAKKKARVSKCCVACGYCVKECPREAISVYRGLYAVVDEEKCIGCGKCVQACIASVIELVPCEESV